MAVWQDDVPSVLQFAPKPVACSLEIARGFRKKDGSPVFISRMGNVATLEGAEDVAQIVGEIVDALVVTPSCLDSDIPANLEAIRHAGETFEQGNVDHLTTKLTSLLARKDYVAERGEEARATVEAHFSWDTIVEEIEGVYITARH